ncbi:SHOCT domain-containing protein [Halovivax cerinus]|uniref:SHOCT domain-containing protein n=1 Tax=Halovivax cerinus TaxID=1487865 RepID=A0ABD5NT89_9EURY|nr:SHOCT domain-containing protein [Halovivax cerinus]
MSSSGGGYDLVELFVLKFVLADVIIIATLLLVGPLAAAGITALLVLSTLLLWYVTKDGDEDPSSTVDERRDRPTSETDDPVTTLQRRYAKGELTEREFERRLDQLIAADERATKADVETDRLSLDRDR